MSILIYAEHDAGQLSSATRSAITCAQALDGPIDMVVCASDCASVATEAAQIAGIRQVFTAEANHLATQPPEGVAWVLESLAANYDYVLAGATSHGKNIFPRLAARLDVQQISDISGVIDAQTFVRPIYAGNALATVRSHDAQRVITVRATAFEPIATGGGDASISAIEPGSDSALVEHLGMQLSGGEGPELTTADIVISGGRGVGSQENFAMVKRVADRLNAAVGASRAAVDAGYITNDYQVGQTGKMVAPKLYLAVGISGAIQHMAGMRESQVIAAINTDPEAPIFEVADYGLVQDLMGALQELDGILAESPTPIGESA